MSRKENSPGVATLSMIFRQAFKMPDCYRQSSTCHVLNHNFQQPFHGCGLQRSIPNEMLYGRMRL